MNLPSIEEFAAGTGHSLRRVIKDSFLRLPDEFKNIKARRMLLERQAGVCPLCKEKLPSHGTHVDHIWTTLEATDAVMAGSVDLISAYNRLWSDKNMRVVHPACNNARNRALSGGEPSLPAT
jgi:5-methylcytosine-specific restriction endonuclease McrA